MFRQRPRSPWPRTAVVALGLAVSAAASLVAVPGAFGASNGVWSISSPPEFGGGSEPINLQIAPGQQAASFVTLENLTNDPLTISVTTSSGQRPDETPPTRPTADGDDVPNPNTSEWLTLSRASSDVGSRSRSSVAFTARVPVGTASGDYVAAIQGTSLGAFNPLTRTRNQLALQILVFIRVTGPLTNKLSTTSLRVDGDIAGFLLTNTGNTRLTPTIAISARGENGADLTAAPAPLTSLEPGQKFPARWRFASEPATIEVSVTSEAPTSVQTWPAKPIDAVVVAPGAPLPEVPNSGDPTAEIWIWVLIVGFLVAVLLVGAARRRRARREARRRSARRAPTAEPFIAPPTQATAPPRPPGYQAPPPAPPPPPQPPTAHGSWVGGEGSRSVVVPRS